MNTPGYIPYVHTKFAPSVELALGLRPSWRADASDQERKDAAVSAFLQLQLQQLEAQIYRKIYPDMLWRTAVPLKNSGLNPGAESFAYRVYDWTGTAKFIGNLADDAPTVDVKGEKFTSKQEPLGAAYQYSLDELLASAMSGFPLESEKASSAAESIERLMDLTTALGNSGVGFTGVLNQSAVSIDTTAANGTGSSTKWADKLTLSDNSGPTKILADLHNFLQAIVTNSFGAIRPDRLIMPFTLYGLIATTPMSPVGYSNETILSAFLKQSPFIRNENQIVVWYHAANANAAGNGGRIVGYAANPSYMETYVPKEIEVLPAQPTGFMFKVPMWAKYGGFVLRQNFAMRYLDGAE